jgi:hypothetical protein
MTRALIANCLQKIGLQLTDIRLCIETLEDLRAAELVDGMECELLAHGRRLRSHLELRLPSSLSSTWTTDEDPLKFLSCAFGRVHDHLSSLRSHACSLADPRTWELVISLELGMLKAMRKLRLHLDIPYDGHEQADLHCDPAPRTNAQPAVAGAE